MNKIDYDMPFDEYLKVPGVSKSALSDFAVSPGFYKFRQEHPRLPTDAMLIGSAIDCLLFDGEKAFDSQYACRPEGVNLSTKAGKEWKAQQVEGGLTILPSKHGSRENIECTVAAISKAAGDLISWGSSQPSLFWEINGVPAKGRTDYITDKAIVDLKTISDFSERSFVRRCIDLKYHWQAAMYTNGHREITGKDLPFFFIAADPETPHRVEIYEVPPSLIELGMYEIEKTLARFVDCEMSGEWPMNSGKIQVLKYPEWALNNND